MLLRWLRALDQLLRGETTRLSALKSGRLEIPLRGLALLIVLLGVTYGACMGVFALLREAGPEWRQLAAAVVKVPALFLLTLAITFPSLYVFNALVGSRLRFLDVLRLLIAGIAVTLAVLASFGPITAFFSVSTTSYPFMVLLNVLMFAIGGLLGLSFLLQTLHRLSVIHARCRRRSQRRASRLAMKKPPGHSVASRTRSPRTLRPIPPVHWRCRRGTCWPGT
jgi:hypothetical protein